MAAAQATAEHASEQKSFEAEVGRLLHLMVHSVYTEKNIFLRELISNASDACDKLRYEAISTPGLLVDGERLAITIRPEPDTGTLVITDNGIGMNRDELIDNLGTIARSGTRAFLERLGDKADGTALIGQFGVGFYSGFMVADEIEVVSRKAGTDDANVWASNGADGFTIRRATTEETAAIPRGTQIRLKLKADSRSYLDGHTLERIVKTYSDHILFPVELIEPAVAPETDGDTDSEPQATALGEPRQINTASALWQRSKSEITPEQYNESYQTLAGAYDKPSLTIHYRAEGRLSYAVMLFVPEQRPFDLYDPTRKGRVKLYVRRVFITDDADLLPTYLCFMRGVVDSEDLPLNISREMLQSNPAVAQMRKALGSRVLSELETFATKDTDGYAAFYEAFGAVLKEALYEDFERRDQVLKLARFKSSTALASGNGVWRSLSDYVTDMRPNQTEIYYLTGDNAERLAASPQLEAARARGIEVLLLTDPIDSFWVTMPSGYDGKPLKSLTQGQVDLSLVPLLDAATPPPETSGKAAVLAARFKEALAGDVADVTVSKRLVSSAVCLVAPGSGPDLTLDRMLAKQERGFGIKPVLEINPNHPLVAALSDAGTAIPAAEVADYAHLLLDQALVLDGQPPGDPARFAATLNRLAVKGLTAPPPTASPAMTSPDA
ncbi:MAG: molecular chaperone HtpG [Hyphomicrobium aestuarii]|nr:molecular chaperone HtpG [Hyphomicrobium aestuarii]